MTDRITHAAKVLAEAQAKADGAAEEVATEHRRADDLRERRTVLVAERDSIAAARRCGHQIDASRLSVIDLDLADLDPLIATAIGVVAAAQSRADSARSTADVHRQALQHERDVVLLDGSTQHAIALGQKLLAAIDEIAAAAKRLGRSGTPEFLPDPRLALEIRRLDLNRPGGVR
jgi:hypothetical protein